MIKNSVPVSAIPLMTPEQKQNHMIGLFTSIDESLKKILLWSEPSAGAGMIELQYEKAFGPEVNSDLVDLMGSGAPAADVVEVAAKIAKAPAKAAAKKAVAPAIPVAETAAEETTLAPAVETVVEAAPVAPVVEAAPVSIDEVRAAAQKFILELTAQGKDGKVAFAAILKAENAQTLTALDKKSYATVLAKMSEVVPATAKAFDPLA